jgi:hypothetical protein
MKRLIVKDRSMPTTIIVRVDILLSSMVDSCYVGIVRVFNTVSLHFAKRGGTNLLVFRVG